MSYVLLRGRCRACGAHIPPWDALLEFWDRGAVRPLGLATGFGLGVARVCLLAASFVAISAIDVEHMRIPSPIVYAQPPSVRRSWSSPQRAPTDGPRCLARSIGGAVAFAAFFALFFAVPKGIGFGDVRLAGLCGGFLGWFGYRYVVVGFLVGFIVAGLPAAALLALRKVQRRTQIPFGPFLAAGAIITVLVGPPLVHAWARI